MRDGKYGPQEALLRMKQDLTSNNPQMWDLTAYRVIQPLKSSNAEEPVEDIYYPGLIMKLVNL